VLSNAVSDGDLNGTYDLLCSQFARTGKPLEVNFRELVKIAPVGRNAHLIHPYPAKLMVKIPQFFLDCSAFAGKCNTLLDPFCGSGTVPLEGQIGGFSIIAVDSNPLARLITEAKLTPIDVNATRCDLESVLQCQPTAQIDIPDVVNREHWFSDRVSEQLGRLKSAIARNVDPERRAIFDVCFSATVRRVSFADPRLSVPVRINPKRADRYGAKGDAALRKLKRLENIDVASVFWKVANQNLRRLNETQEHFPQRSEEVCILKDATDLGLSDSSIDLVITSPPYVGAQKYIRASSLSLGWLGLTPNSQLRQYEKRTIGREHMLKEECPSSYKLEHVSA
jgi:hypothetical protein